MTIFEQWLRQLEDSFAHDPSYRPNAIEGPFGTHGVMYETDEDGADCAIVGFVLPKGVYAEIEDGTYGTMQGFRFYLGTYSTLCPSCEELRPCAESGIVPGSVCPHCGHVEPEDDDS